MYIYNHESKMPSRLSPQWLCGNSWMTLDYLYVCIYMYDIYIYIYIYISITLNIEHCRIGKTLVNTNF